MRRFGWRTISCIVTAATLTGVAQVPMASAAPRIQTIWNFGAGMDGAEPNDTLRLGPDGALYGVTAYGGEHYDGGTVFRLYRPRGQATWQETVIWSFPSYSYPGGRLLVRKSGKIYGTTEQGGATAGGSVFELTPPGIGQTQWSESDLWSFGGGSDGRNPEGSGVVAGPEGVLYGATANGGTANLGTVFRLAPPASGQGSWSEAVLWNFTGNADGANPTGELIVTTEGALIGVTTNGASGSGTVYELLPPSAGTTTWTERTLWTFSGGVYSEGPSGSLLLSATGSLFGTTFSGGYFGSGDVFRLDPPSPGQTGWTETVLWNFSRGSNGSNPQSGLFGDPNVALFGTTAYGGPGGAGTVYRLTPPPAGSGAWTYSVLASFLYGSADGSNPMSGLAPEQKGKLLGTLAFVGITPYGGIRLRGIAFRVVP